jgi:cyclopropane-fatty-acyl-phospholipid synthase
MERICRKLALDSGDRVVEAGCGWGALALYMARHCGARVRAFNLSHEQVEYARRRAAREGLASAVEFIEDDYRNVGGTFDAFVSIGMLEHVGAEHYPELARMLGRWLGVSGRGLLHFIGRSRPEPLSPWIRRRIFPGAYAPALSEALALLEQGDYAVLDVENLRSHYARTLACWRERFEAARGEAARLFDGQFLRAWRLYLAGSEAAFQTGNLQLFQVLFAGRECRRRLWTREWAAREEPAWSV